VEGGDELGKRLAAFSELPFLDETMRAAIEAAQGRATTELGVVGEASGMELIRVDGGYALRIPGEVAAARELGTPDAWEDPVLSPAVQDMRGAFVASVQDGVRSALWRLRGTA